MDEWLVCSYLFVICKTPEQSSQVIDRFNKEKPDQGIFQLHQPKKNPLKVCFQLCEPEVEDNFDEVLLALVQWLKTSFSLAFEGYIWIESGCTRYRAEIHDIDIVCAELDWLESYSVEQLTKIRQFAETTFPENKSQESYEESGFFDKELILGHCQSRGPLVI